MKPVPDHPLVPLPPQPEGVAWPTTEWPSADPGELGADVGRLTALLDQLVADDPDPVVGRTYAAAVVAGGRLVAERYGLRPVRDLRSLGDDPPLEQLGPDDELLSWSMAKSLANLAVGVAVADGALSVDDPVGDPRWAADGDPRAAISWSDLLTMQAGLAWTEEYYDVDDDDLPDVMKMLWGEGATDMAAYAADKA
ncbi:MAG: serine hydrolase, partial [Acidimicrobiales bacterium]|nr:serine hydrolase [Acidimicrobiales bacterium]